MAKTNSNGFLNKIRDYFEFSKHKTNFKVEILAGVSTFLALSYIFVVTHFLSLSFHEKSTNDFLKSKSNRFKNSLATNLSLSHKNS